MSDQIGVKITFKGSDNSLKVQKNYFCNGTLERAKLERAKLERAYLIEANLEGANLQGANLKWTYLIGANFKDANLKGADLEGANLEGAQHLSLDQLSIVKTLLNSKLDNELLITLKKKYAALFKVSDYSTSPTGSENHLSPLRFQTFNRKVF